MINSRKEGDEDVCGRASSVATRGKVKGGGRERVKEGGRGRVKGEGRCWEGIGSHRFEMGHWRDFIGSKSGQVRSGLSVNIL